MLDVMPNTAIQCTTIEEYDALMQMLEEAGFTWPIGYHAPWEQYGSDICINIRNKYLSFCGTAFYKRQGTTIIPFAELTGKHAKICPACKGTRVYVGLFETGACRECCKE